MASPQTTNEAQGSARSGGRLGRRLLWRVVVVALGFTVLLTALQLGLDYRQERRLLETRVDEIRRVSLPGIAQSLWTLDERQLQLHLEGITRLPGIAAAELRGSREFDPEPLHLHVGRLDVEAPLHWEMAITHRVNGEAKMLGQLQLTGTLAPLYASLADRAALLLGVQGISIMAVALALLSLFNRLVAHPLARLASDLDSLSVEQPDRPIVLARPPSQRPDELDRVAAALQQSYQRLAEAHHALERSNAALARDIAARQEAERQAAFLANHDALTGLANRRALYQRLAHEVQRAQRSGNIGALLFIDFDRFKSINDAFGHSLGDRVLVEAAKAMRSALREIDLLARWGGDEFVAILAELGNNADAAAVDAQRVAERVRCELSRPLNVDGHSLRLGGSIGITLFPTGGTDLDMLLQHADAAMYLAKESGRDAIRFYQQDLHAALLARHGLLHELREALANDGFSLVWQPLVDAEGRTQGAEALLRWISPTRGPVSPAEFIPVCEDSGLIVAVGDWVLQRVCAQAARWQRDGLLGRGRYLGLNISPRQFAQPDFVERLIAVVDDSGVDADCIAIEITEGVVLENIEQAIERILRLRARGLHVFIDDFGSGYSSLSYLKKLPVEGIKIDQSFVRDLDVDGNDAAIVEAVLAIGQRFGLKVIAEGVETPAQFEHLRRHGCRAFQGYYFGRPDGAEKLAERLRDEQLTA